MSEQVIADPRLTVAEAICLLKSWELQEYPVFNVDGEDAEEVLGRAKKKLSALLPDDWLERVEDRSPPHDVLMDDVPVP